MKKSQIAVYLALLMFAVTFIVASVLDGVGRRREGHIFAYALFPVLGGTLLLAVLSNKLNYGYFWVGVKKRDRFLSFSQLDEKYPRVLKGSSRYALAMVCVSAVAIAMIIFGVTRIAQLVEDF